MRRKLIVALCIALSLLFSCSALAAFDDCMMSAIIYNCKDYVSLRSWPSTSAPVLERVYLGEEVTLLSRAMNREGNADFVLVETDRNVGYILIQYIHAIIDDYYYVQQDNYGIGYGTVTSKDPNYHTVLRTGPSTDYSALGYLFGGEVIPYLGTSQKDRSGRVWYCCSLDGTTCWISSKYTKLRRP